MLIDTTCPSERRGLAWAPGNAEQDLSVFCARWWYGMAAPGQAVYTGGRIPIIPCRSFYSYQVALGLGDAYDGYLILFNEPDRPDQCNITPKEGAVTYVEIRRLLPAAHIVGPNAIDTGWLAAWIEAVEQLTGARPAVTYGIHVYGAVGPAERIEASCAVIGEECRLWVTEWGQCEPGLFADWLWQIEHDERVARHFAYTTHTQGYAADCYSFYESLDSRRLTTIGRVFAGRDW